MQDNNQQGFVKNVCREQYYFFLRGSTEWCASGKKQAFWARFFRKREENCFLFGSAVNRSTWQIAARVHQTGSPPPKGFLVFTLLLTLLQAWVDGVRPGAFGLCLPVGCNLDFFSPSPWKDFLNKINLETNLILHSQYGWRGKNDCFGQKVSRQNPGGDRNAQQGRGEVDCISLDPGNTVSDLS